MHVHKGKRTHRDPRTRAQMYRHKYTHARIYKGLQEKAISACRKK